MAVGTLTLLSTSMDSTTKTFSFLTANLPEGFLLAVEAHQEEELISPGVDGRRWRTLYDQFPEFEMATIADFTAYSSAIAEGKLYHQCAGRLANLSLTISGSNYLINRLHIRGCVPRASPGATAGAGVTSGAAAVLFGTWALVPTE